ncbi:MAG: hypothetical protein V1914_02275 [archaeon]
MDFEKGIVDSIKQLRHPIIFVPDLVFVLTTLVLGLGFFKFTGMRDIISNLALTEGFQQELFKGLLADKWASLVIGVAVIFIITFTLGVGVELIRFTLIKDLITGNKKLDIVKAWKSSKGMFWDVVVLKIFVYLLSILVLLMLALIGWGVYVLVGNINSVLSVGLISLFGLVLLVLLKLFLLFRYPILFLEKGKSPAGVIKSSFKFARTQFWYVFLVALILVVVMLVFAFITSPISIGLDYLQGLLIAGTFWAFVFSYFAKLVMSVVNLVYALWMQLFVFNSYVHRKRKKGL